MVCVVISYPALRIAVASEVACTLDVIFNDASSVARLTLTSITPVVCLSAFSTRNTQEAQLIPLIPNRSSTGKLTSDVADIGISLGLPWSHAEASNRGKGKHFDRIFLNCLNFLRVTAFDVDHMPKHLFFCQE